MKRVALVAVVLLITVSCSETSDKKPTASSSPSPSPTATYARQAKAPIQPASWIATDLDDADAWAGRDSILLGNDVAVMSIDPEKERVRWRTDVPAFGVAEGFGSVWVSDGEGGVVRRLDPGTGKVTATVQLDYPIGLAAGPDGVWAAGHHDGTVARIDPETNKVAARTKVGPEGNGGPHQLTIDGEHLYVDMSNANTVVEVDIGTGKVLRTFELPGVFSACGPMRVDEAVLWVTACLEKEKVARIDLASGAITISEVGSWAGGFLVRGDTLWLSTKTVPPDFSSTGGVIVGVNRSDGQKVASLRTDTTDYGSVEAFGSWWLPTKGGVARYRPSDLDRRR